jgi:hypothetical protein
MAFAGEEAAVQFRGAVEDDPVDGHPRAGADEDGVSGGDGGDGGFDFRAVDEEDRAGDFEGGQFLGRRAGNGAGAVVEVAAEEQEERQHHGGVEIGVVARHRGFIDRDGGGEDQGEADRDIHAEAALAERGPGGFEEGLAGEDHRGQRDGAGDPVEEIAGGVLGSGPDGHGEEHDVHHAEEGDAEAHQEFAALAVGFGDGEEAGVKFVGFLALGFKGFDQLGGGNVAVGLDADALEGEVDAGRMNSGEGLKRGLDGGDRLCAACVRKRQDDAARPFGAQGGNAFGGGDDDAGRAGGGRGAVGREVFGEGHVSLSRRARTAVRRASRRQRWR